MRRGSAAPPGPASGKGLPSVPWPPPWRRAWRASAPRNASDAPETRPVLKKKPVPAPSASWTASAWPDAILSLPLDMQFRPLDERRLGQVAAGQLPECRAVFVAPATAELRPDLVAHLRAAMATRPDIGIFYGDDAVVDGAGQIRSVHCKPAFNPALLMADDYI